MKTHKGVWKTRSLCRRIGMAVLCGLTSWLPSCSTAETNAAREYTLVVDWSQSLLGRQTFYVLNGGRMSIFVVSRFTVISDNQNSRLATIRNPDFQPTG